MQPHIIASREEWIAARKAHLAQEKEYTKARERLAEERRALPWVKVDKDYVFDGPDGKVSLADLFKGRSQLVVQHVMFAPDWNEACKSCSFWADGFERMIPHLAARDTTMVAISRAPLQKLAAFKQRMGWTFDWLSSGGNAFNYDYGVSFTPEQIERGGNYNFGTTPFGSEEAAQPTLDCAMHDHHQAGCRDDRASRDRPAYRRAVPPIRRVDRGPLPAQERPPLGALPREVPGPPGPGCYQ